MSDLLITPGNWRRDYGYIYSPRLKTTFIAMTGDSENWLADASLIAAAPDLYRALDLCLEEMMFSEGGEPLSFRKAIVEAKQALAKARGEL